MPPELGQLEPRTLWTREAYDFTPWLADNLSLLGEALGLDLELAQIEPAVGAFNADITARDTGRDRHVIIENQLEPTDHGHLGQLITYAAGLDAAVIAWISPEIREEHRQAIDWLNRHTSEKIEFFAIALEVVRIGDSKPAVIRTWLVRALLTLKESFGSRLVGAVELARQIVSENLTESTR
jgi:hypothetical protein